MGGKVRGVCMCMCMCNTVYVYVYVYVYVCVCVCMCVSVIFVLLFLSHLYTSISFFLSLYYYTGRLPPLLKKQQLFFTATMVRLTSILLITSATSVLGFSPKSTINTVSQKNTALKESFGFDFAEDQAENTPSVILGEANYKQWVGENIDNSFLNRQVRIL